MTNIPSPIVLTMPATLFMRLRHLTIGMFICFTCGACTMFQQTPAPYSPPDRLELASSLRQDFVQEFLAGRWCTARTLFLQAQEYYLRQDDFCSVAKTYILAYKLHAYLGVTYPHLLDKAMNFAQQGLDCTSEILDDKGQPRTGKRDKTIHDLIIAKKWPAVLDQLNRERDPLFASVYARKAARQARQTDALWSTKFLDLAHTIDSRQGWVLFLIQDWKLQEILESNPQRRIWIKQRIATLYNLVEPCDQPFSGSETI